VIPVRYVSAALDSSGYANAARNYIDALLSTNSVDLSIGLASFEQNKTNHGSIQDKILSLVNYENNHRIQIIHLTPENFPNWINKNKYNIGYTVWETDKLPVNWVHLCNMLDEVWVPSEWNVKIFKNSGVTKPIYCIPHCIQIPENQDHVQPLSIGNDPSTFIFYSVFQWIERKNPIALLKAYLTEFKKEENVCLALKTYRINDTPAEQDLIKKDIAAIKKSLHFEEFPLMYFFGNLFTADNMKALHKRGNCFVLPTRAEGFGIPQAEAMSWGKPVISTSFSGQKEFMNVENSYLIDYQLTPCSGMIFGNYDGSMTWSDPNIMHLRKLMRQVFVHQEEARQKGKLAQQTIQDKYSRDIIGKLMLKRLREIQKSL